MNDLESLAKLLQALRPWAGNLVVVGGWAHRLYRFAPQVNNPAYQPVNTRETDLAFNTNEPIEGDIKDALEKAGFSEQLAGEHQPPVTKYTLGDNDEGFYAEFLTPLQGSGWKRTGKPDMTLSVAGITAQKLRHLEILLNDPLIIKVGPENNLPLPKAIDVQIANPVSYIVQKLLIQEYRKRQKRAQDLLYIHDTLQLFGGQLPELNRTWKESVEPRLSEKLRSQVFRVVEESFSNVSDTIREAVLIPQDRRLSPENFQKACQLALSGVLN